MDNKDKTPDINIDSIFENVEKAVAENKEPQPVSKQFSYNPPPTDIPGKRYMTTSPWVTGAKVNDQPVNPEPICDTNILKPNMRPNPLLDIQIPMKKRFMDATHDHYNYMDFAMGFPVTVDMNETDRRYNVIRRHITVEEWDILNGTNFSSPKEKIVRYIEIIQGLIDHGVFGPADTIQPSFVYYTIDNDGKIHEQPTPGANVNEFNKWAHESRERWTSTIVGDTRWLWIRVMSYEPKESIEMSARAIAKKFM